MLCLHLLFTVTPIQGSKSLQLLTPAESTLPMSLSSVGMTTWSTTQSRKASLPICVSRGGSHMQFKATQWAKVAESRAVISVPMRLTSTSVLQFSQTRGPIYYGSHSANRAVQCLHHKCTFRQCSRFVGMVHVKGDGRKREATRKHVCLAVPLVPGRCYPLFYD